MISIAKSKFLTGVFCALACMAGAQEAPVVLFPFREATVASAVDTSLKEYRYKVGEPFTNGAVIAELDGARYRVAHDRTREHRDFAAQVAKEQRELRTKDFASEMDLRKAEYEAKIAAADFEEAEINLRHCSLIAPFNGKIAELLTQQYETVKPGQPLFRIIEDDRLLAVANLPLGTVKVGDKVKIVPDSGSEVEGVVYEVAPQADNRTGTVRVRVLVENASGSLNAGMTGVLMTGESEPPKTVSESFKSPDVVAAPLQIAGVPFATVSDAFNGVTPYAMVVSNNWHEILSASNRPAHWLDRELMVVPRTSTVADVFALPELSIEAMGFEAGKLTYVVRRYPRAMSISNLKRVGELAAGLYDEDGDRVAYIAPRQVDLPRSGETVTNVVEFDAEEYSEAIEEGGPLKLVLRVETDVRAMTINSEDEANGGE